MKQDSVSDILSYYQKRMYYERYTSFEIDSQTAGTSDLTSGPPSFAFYQVQGPILVKK